MSEIWKRIIAWFIANVPSKFFAPMPGVSHDEINAAESRMHLHLPEDVREFYLLHNGVGEYGLFFDGYELLTLDQIVTFWKGAERVLDVQEAGLLPGLDDYCSPVGPIKKVMWNLKWVPIMDADGNGVLIDLDPAPGGNVGQVIERSSDMGPLRVLADNFRNFLSRYADELEAGKYAYDHSSTEIRKIKD
jgi:cell wall assembly regulator SMI1